MHGEKNGAAGRMLTLHVTDPYLILGTTESQ